MHSAEESPAGIEEKAIKVLIVEDDPGNTKLVRLMLSKSVQPYEAEVAGNIATAIKRMHDDAFDTTLLDLGLPDSQGTDTVLRVHTECPEVPIIVLTGLDDEETGIRAVQIGAQDYLVKGAVDSNLLTRSIRYAIARKRAEEEIKASLREKEELLREIHHRVKNNLQIISSLLKMQAMRIEDRKIVDALLDSRSRVQTMALIHTQLCQSENIAQVEMGNTISKLVEDLLQIYVKEETNISFVVTAEGVNLPISQAIPLGLIINELVSNALKYAFRDTEKGSIEISMSASAGDFIELTVRDDGIGIPEDFEISKTQTLGLKLVKNLAERQLNGEISVNRDKGTRFCVKYNKSILYGGNDE